MQVRREFLSCLGDWLLNLRERMDHEPRLMPFIMSALSDDVPEIQVSLLLGLTSAVSDLDGRMHAPLTSWCDVSQQWCKANVLCASSGAAADLCLQSLSARCLSQGLGLE